MSGPQSFLPAGGIDQPLDVSTVATNGDPWGPARTSSSGAMSDPSTQAATVGGGAPLRKRCRFFTSGTILTASWGPGSADELEDEYPGVEFDVHKPKVGKKASITIMGPSKVVLRGVVETLLEQVGGALVLDEEIYRELPSGDSEVVGTLATAPSTADTGSKSNTASPQTASDAPGSNVISLTQPMLMPPNGRLTSANATPFTPVPVTGSAGEQQAPPPNNRLKVDAAPFTPMPGAVPNVVSTGALPQTAGSNAAGPNGTSLTQPMPPNTRLTANAAPFTPMSVPGSAGVQAPLVSPPSYTPGTVAVIDPISTKLEIPYEAMHHTESSRRHGTPSLCMLFLKMRCRQGEHCHQAHADIKVVLALRAKAQANLKCCIIHGAQNKMPAHWEEKYLILFQGGSGNPHPITRLAMTAGLQKFIDEYEQLNGPPPLDQQICLCVDSSNICRMVGNNRCRFHIECNFIHLCKELLYHEFPHESRNTKKLTKAALEPIVQGTIDALGALISTPTLTPSLLSKPPFRLLFDIVVSVNTEHPHVFQGEVLPMDLDPTSAGNEDKIAWLERIFAEVGAGLGRPVNCDANYVIAGLQPERTNLFLQDLAALVNLPHYTRGAARPRSYLEQQHMEPTKHKEPTQHKEQQHSTLNVSAKAFAIPGLEKATNSVDSWTAISNEESSNSSWSNTAPAEQHYVGSV